MATLTHAFDEERILNLVSNRTLVAVCNGGGVILELPNSRVFRFPALVEKLKAGRRLSEMFDLGTLRDFSELPNGVSQFSARAGTLFFENIENFYSNLSMIAAKITRLAEGRYLALIVISDMVPNYYPERTSGIFLVDQTGRLAGFNQSFYEAFRVFAPLPDRMLGLPLDTFLSPTPHEAQTLFLPSFDYAERQTFENMYRRDFTAQPLLKGEPGLSGGATLPTPEGTRWTGERDDLSYFTLPAAFDPLARDFFLELELKSDQEHAAAFILGPAARERQPPDVEGYLVSKHPTLELALVKRSGHILSLRDAWKNGRSGFFKLSFFKIGASLFLFRDGVRVLGFYDHHFAPAGPQALTLGLRPGCACVLRSVTFASRPAGSEAEEPSPLIVKLKPPARGFYLLSRFYNNALSSSHQTVQGYLLQDVTGFQERVEKLTVEYEKQLKRGQRLETLLKSIRQPQEPFVGSSPAIKSLKEKSKLIANSKATVLIQGATGTGKEVLAHFIHANSPYASGPFVKVDCSTLPKDLMESELFGHEKGSFTGAVQRKTGMFEQANKGTLFLDEVANLTPEAQAKLLQFLQDFTIFRVGGDKPIPLDLRVVAATNVPLEILVKKNAFREDLYYRLFVVVMNIPPLKERAEDLPELCGHFLNLFNTLGKKKIEKISPAAFKRIHSHDWPGNIRELKNVLQRAVLFCEGNELTEELVVFSTAIEEGGGKPAAGENVGPKTAYHQLSRMTPEEFQAHLAAHKGNVVRVAKALGVSRRALYYHFKKKGIDVGGFR